MSKNKKRKLIQQKLAAYFIQIGKILTATEYNKLGEGQPVLASSIKKVCKHYDIIEKVLRADEALVALVAQSAALQAPKAVKPIPKVKPVTKAKPASKLGASTVEK
tara:strand:- start:1671 stop:1988 length:318 start_codon:yes stop_codon:yes gene_type:complete